MRFDNAFEAVRTYAIEAAKTAWPGLKVYRSEQKQEPKEFPYISVQRLGEIEQSREDGTVGPNGFDEALVRFGIIRVAKWEDGQDIDGESALLTAQIVHELNQDIAPGGVGFSPQVDTILEPHQADKTEFYAGVVWSVRFQYRRKGVDPE